VASPTNFVSFADYLGLNAEDAKRMSDSAFQGAGTDSGALEGLAGKQYGLEQGQVEGTDTGQYEAAGEKARTGLASYGTFLKKMSDPAERQQMLEEAFGKGSVNSLDTALAGVGGQSRVASEQERLKSIGAGLDERGAATEEARTVQERQKAAALAREERLSRIAASVKAQRAAAKEARIQADRQRVHEWGQSHVGGLDKFVQETGRKLGIGGEVWSDPRDPSKLGWQGMRRDAYKAGKLTRYELTEEERGLGW
jgi:hypothetical protein